MAKLKLIIKKDIPELSFTKSWLTLRKSIIRISSFNVFGQKKNRGLILTEKRFQEVLILTDFWIKLRVLNPLKEEIFPLKWSPNLLMTEREIC